MPVRKGTTISDVAKAAGLSPATVSLIINRRNLSSFLPETVELVNRTVEELNYKKSPSKTKVNITGTKGMIAIICPSVMNPYYAVLIQGMEQIVRENGYSTCIFTTYWDPQAEAQALGEAGRSGSNIIGIIYSMVPQLPELAVKYAKKLPVVVVGDRRTNITVDMAELNNYNGGVLIANHLIELGHRHIAYLSTTLNDDHSSRVMRLEGIRDTFRQRCPDGSVTVREAVVTPQEELNTTEIEHKIGYELTMGTLDDHKITAIAAINDMVAYGVLDALKDAGKKVPEDYSVSGFDNIYPSRLRSVELTTVEHSTEKKGRSAARLLLDKIAAEQDGGIQREKTGLMRVEYENFLVRGRTTAPPPKDKI